MSIPTTDREQLIISSTGAESYPVVTFAKGTMWCVYSRFGNLYLKDYDGNRFRRIRIKNKGFYVSAALDASRQVIADRFWLWEVTFDGEVNLIEMEPFLNEDPVVHAETRLINSGILNIRAEVSPGRYTRVFMLNDTPKELQLKIYPYPMSGTPSYQQSLPWSASRLEDFSTGRRDAPPGFDIALIDVASPPNVYEEGYVHPAPAITLVEQNARFRAAHVIWSAVTGTEEYVLQRADDAAFTTGVVTVYNGTDTDIIDPVPNYQWYYYRVMSRIITADIESVWSDIEGVEIIPPRMFNIYPVMYVDFNRTTYGHEGTWRDNFSLKDLQEFLDFLYYREMAYTEQIIFKCRGRAMGILKIHDFRGSPGNLMRFESSDPVNDPAILVFDESLLNIET